MAPPLRCDPSLFTQDLTGRTYVVTGGNSGIGQATVEQLAKQGARVVLACRRTAEGERVRDELGRQPLRGSIQVLPLDLASLASVRSFAAAVLAEHAALHGLVNNAGVMNTPAGRTVDGFEMQFGVNHLGHYLLTELLLPALRRGAPSRVVNVSSCFHDKAVGREGHIDFEDLQFDRKPYDGWAAYAQSKLANLLHARQLARREQAHGVTAVSVHPGWVRSNLIQHSMPVWMQNAMAPLFRLVGMIEPKDGAQSTLYALLSPEVPALTGAYFSQRGFYRAMKYNVGGWPMQSPNPEAHRDDVMERLDAVSRSLVGGDVSIG